MQFSIGVRLPKVADLFSRFCATSRQKIYSQYMLMVCGVLSTVAAALPVLATPKRLRLNVMSCLSGCNRIHSCDKGGKSLSQQPHEQECRTKQSAQPSNAHRESLGAKRFPRPKMKLPTFGGQSV
jgi:hypothetical protein